MFYIVLVGTADDNEWTQHHVLHRSEWYSSGGNLPVGWWLPLQYICGVSIIIHHPKIKYCLNHPSCEHLYILSIRTQNVSQKALMHKIWTISGINSLDFYNRIYLIWFNNSSWCKYANIWQFHRVFKMYSWGTRGFWLQLDLKR